MIKNFEDFVGTHLNESGYKRYPNDNSDYFEEYVKMTGECAIANIELVKENGGRVEFKETLIARFYDRESNFESPIIKLIRKDIVALFVDDDEDNAESKYGIHDIELFELESTDDGEFLVAVTNEGEEIAVNSHITCPCQTIFDINSELEYLAHNGFIK